MFQGLFCIFSVAPLVEHVPNHSEQKTVAKSVVASESIKFSRLISY